MKVEKILLYGKETNYEHIESMTYIYIVRIDGEMQRRADFNQRKSHRESHWKIKGQADFNIGLCEGRF
jgi:hypothetical protein